MTLDRSRNIAQPPPLAADGLGMSDGDMRCQPWVTPEVPAVDCPPDGGRIGHTAAVCAPAVALEHVPHAHLEHLLNKALEASEVEAEATADYLKKLRSRDAGDRQEALDAIEAWEAGTLERLNETWEFLAARAVQLWTLPCFADGDVESTLARHPDVKRHTGELVEFGKRFKKTAEKARVRRARAEEQELLVVVYLTRTISWELEDEPRGDERTQKVIVRLTFQNAMPLAEVYASSSQARIAILAVLDWLRGSLTPRGKSEEQRDVMIPVAFSESQIVTFAEKMGFEEATMVDGPDPLRQVGQVKLTGKKLGTARAPLDRQFKKVADQLDKAKNSTRTWAFDFVHDDEFKERPEITFHFKGTPHVTFNTRASRPAIDWLIGELRASLRV